MLKKLCRGSKSNRLVANGFVVRDDKRRHFTLKRFCSSASTTFRHWHARIFLVLLLFSFLFHFHTQSIFNLIRFSLMFPYIAMSLTMSPIAFARARFFVCHCMRRNEIKSSSSTTMSSFLSRCFEKKNTTTKRYPGPSELHCMCIFILFLELQKKKTFRKKKIANTEINRMIRFRFRAHGTEREL